MRTHLSHGSSGGGDMLLGEPKRACHRERATESVPPRACHLERSAPPSAAGVGCGWCSGAVIEQQAPARHAECTRDASRVHALLVQRQTASASAEKGARADSCTPATARAAQRECWLTSGRLTVLGQPGSPSARAAASDTTSSQGDAFFRGRRGSFPPRGGVRRRPRRAPAALETSRRPGRALTKLRALGEAKRPTGAREANSRVNHKQVQLATK